jgi:hypothetical protein
VAEVVSLSDFRLKKAMACLSKTYSDSPDIFKKYVETMDTYWFRKELMSLDARIERLDKLIQARSGYIDFALLKEKQEVVLYRHNLIQDYDKRRGQ